MAKGYRRLNLFMAKPLVDGQTFAKLLADAPTVSYPLAADLDIDGVLFVKQSAEKRPGWGAVLDEATGVNVEGLANRSSSAVLLLRVDGDIFAFTFGYGR